MRKKVTSLLLILCLSLSGFTQGAGNALHYDGTNGYVSAALPSVFNNIAVNDFTIETWLAVESSSASKRVFFAQLNSNNFISILVNSSNIPYVFLMDAGTTYSANTSTTLASGVWNHFAVTWDASANTMTCYINGTQVSYIAGGVSSIGNDNTMTIGSRTDGDQKFKGSLDNFRIWSDIRTECEIYGAMTTEFTTPQPNLIASYNFNSGIPGANNAGVITLDELNGSFDGTLNGFLLNGGTSNWVNSGSTIYSQNNNDGIAHITDTEVDCESFTWIDGNTYSSSVSGVTYSHNAVNGCPIISTLNLTIHGLPNVDAGSDISICEGESVTLSGTGATNYNWNNGITDNVSFVPSATTNYTLTGTDVNGCINTDEVLVTVNALPNVDAGPDQTACHGEDVIFSGAGAVNYVWNNGIDNNIAFSAVASGTYIVEGTDANGCVNTDEAELTVNPLPTVNAGTDQAVCAETAVTLTGSGDAVNYNWNNGVTDNVAFIPSSTSEYIVTGEDLNGCFNSDTVTITVNDLPTTTIVLTGLTLEVATAASYQWFNCDSETEITGETSQNFTVTNNGNYSVIVTGSNGCVDTSACTLINFVGLEDFADNNFQVYPNPAKDFFTINGLNPNTIHVVSFYDTAGKLIFQTSFSGTTLTIPTAELDRGMYVVKIQTSEIEYTPVKIILN